MFARTPEVGFWHAVSGITLGLATLCLLADCASLKHNK
jgi:hypothetical protein